MGTLFTIIVSGFVISVICMAYLIFRTWYLSEKTIDGDKQDWRQKESNVNWLGILLFSTGVFYVSCLIGIGMHFILNNNGLIMRMSMFALATAMPIYLVRTMETIGQTETLAVWIVFTCAIGTMASL